VSPRFWSSEELTRAYFAVHDTRMVSRPFRLCLRSGLPPCMRALALWCCLAGMAFAAPPAAPTDKPAAIAPAVPEAARALYLSALEAYAKRDYPAALERSKAAVAMHESYVSAARLWQAAQGLVLSPWSLGALDASETNVLCAFQPGSLEDAIATLRLALGEQYPGRPIVIRNLAGEGTKAGEGMAIDRKSVAFAAGRLAARHGVDVVIVGAVVEFVPRTGTGWGARQQALQSAKPPPPPPAAFDEHPEIALARMVYAVEPVRLFEVDSAPGDEVIRQGAELGRARPGFLASAWRRQGDLLVLQLDLPIGGRRLVCASGSGFAPVIGAAGLAAGESHAPPRDPVLAPSMQAVRVTEVPTTPGTVLRDLRSRQLLLSNARGSLARAWQIKGTSATSTPGILETRMGRFLGWLDDVGTESAEMTWPQLIRQNAANYRLAADGKAGLQKGHVVMEIADFTDNRRPLLVSANPESYRFRTTHYASVLEGGTAALRACIDAEIHPGVELAPNDSAAPKPDPNIAGDLPELGPGASLRSIRVRFERRAEAQTWFTLEFETANALSGRLTRLQKVLALENDPDGCLRFTDGIKIHEIAPTGSGLERRTYEVEENPFAARR
jgi:hypothetical protein